MLDQNHPRTEMTTPNRFAELAKAVHDLGSGFAERADRHDAEDAFVTENYTELKQARFFSAMVPAEFGGGGVRHSEMAALLCTLATYCPSTALAVSMHQHLVAAAVFNDRNGKPGRKLLEAVAAKELVLVSTGATDWLSSNGLAEKVEGGFRVNARKIFASGSPAGDMAITSAPYENPDEGWQVLHFPLPLSADGVRMEADWRAMGMRGTGSNTLVFEDAFVPEDAIALARPRSNYHGIWNIVLTVAMPLITGVYIGIADRAVELARQQAANRTYDPSAPYLIGEMENFRVAAELAYDSMVAIANDFDFQPTNETANRILIRKTLAVNAARDAVAKAMESVGGGGYFRSKGLERLMRDVQAGQYHPLAEKKQVLFTGRLSLGLDPVAAID